MNIALALHLPNPFQFPMPIVFGSTTKPCFRRLLTRCIVPYACFAKRHLNAQKYSVPVNFLHFWLGNVLRATTAYTFSTSQLPEVVRTWGVLCMISKIASHHNDVHFFDISASKSAPRLKCFVHFNFEIYFTPQRHTIFHLSSGQIAPHAPL
jgi:hypothetical protein